jgi:tellurite resistance protein TehA-like permease
MATGIVSIGARLLGIAVIDVALLAVNGVVYAALWLLMALRLARARAGVLAELGDQRRGAGFLAIVAATCVIGSQAILIGHSPAAATGLLVLGGALWLVLLYALVTVFTVQSDKPPVIESIDGTWLLPVVATESLAVLIAQLTPHWRPSLRAEADFAALALCFGGAMLYAWIAGLIFYRYVFVRILPADLSPTYWINVGAMAIAALAGALLIADAPGAPLLASLRPFLEGFTVLSWATATWWIPLIAILTVWRHAAGRMPLRYDVQYWAAVFPLGMYAVATFELARALSLGFLDLIPHVVFWIAFVAWALTGGGTLRAAVSRRWSRPRPAP